LIFREKCRVNFKTKFACLREHRNDGVRYSLGSMTCENENGVCIWLESVSRLPNVMSGTGLTASLIGVCECIDGTSWLVRTVERFRNDRTVVANDDEYRRPDQLPRNPRLCGLCTFSRRRPATSSYLRRQLGRNRTAGRSKVSTVFHVHFLAHGGLGDDLRHNTNSFWAIVFTLVIGATRRRQSRPTRWVYRAADTDANSYIVAVQLVTSVNKSSDLSTCGLPNLSLYFRLFRVCGLWPGKRWTPVVGHIGHPRVANCEVQCPIKIWYTNSIRAPSNHEHESHFPRPLPTAAPAELVWWFRR